ncbi:hypothetical protein GUJ93_ZPchr0013g35696 [Zizania palustris]|uniref:Uncharacterized protein n=1 Tax=Zizania palustris TaxID=103762 RepID=A0A8J6BVI5_ZIZPA|nr:hypothetical protein GUJ93_ZPchr0013g35696 [Zizania palustris]
MEPAADKREPEQEEQQPPSHDAPAVPSADEDEAEAEENERRNRELKAGLHPLRRKFVLWYTRRTPGTRSQSYEDNIKKIVDFSTVESFWVCYCHLSRPSSLPNPTDLHLFKEGIRPLWEVGTQYTVLLSVIVFCVVLHLYMFLVVNGVWLSRILQIGMAANGS